MTVPNRRTFKGRVARWVVDRLGEACLMDRKERAARLLEEAAELAQAEGVPFPYATGIIQRVYSREPGVPSQEMGGVMVCAIAWGVAAGEDPDVLTEREISRIEGVPAEVTRAKHAAKAAAGTAIEAKAPAVVDCRRCMHAVQADDGLGCSAPGMNARVVPIHSDGYTEPCDDFKERP